MFESFSERTAKAQVVRLGGREIVVTEGAQLSFWADISHRCMTASWPAFIAGAALVFVGLGVVDLCVRRRVEYDVMARNGTRAEQQKADPPPYVPGMEAAGIVDEVGSGVPERLGVGDPRASFGSCRCRDTW